MRGRTNATNGNASILVSILLNYLGLCCAITRGGRTDLTSATHTNIGGEKNGKRNQEVFELNLVHYILPRYGWKEWLQ